MYADAHKINAQSSPSVPFQGWVGPLVAFEVKYSTRVANEKRERERKSREREREREKERERERERGKHCAFRNPGSLLGFPNERMNERERGFSLCRRRQPI